MAKIPFQIHSFSASFRPQSFSRMACGAPSPFLRRVKGSFLHLNTDKFGLSIKSNGIIRRSKLIVCVMEADRSGDDSSKFNLNLVIKKARQLWDSTPKPVKEFPWCRTMENFVQIILDLIFAVVKYLSVPLLAVTSISELSYCASVKKLALVPVPLLIGFFVAGILKEVALKRSSLLKDARVPWHLIAIAIVFTLIKLPGPYYPFWGRVLIPHFANGALWRTVWSMFMWYRRSKTVSGR